MRLSFNKIFYNRRSNVLSRDLFGMNFPNTLGYVFDTGLYQDKYNSPSLIKYGFVEVGPYTLKPQESSQKRMFIKRLTGVNVNRGVRALIEDIKDDKPEMPLCVNISHNDSSIEEESIIRDYTTMYSLVYDFADMILVDSSVKNSDNSKPLQDISFLCDVLDKLLEIRVYYEIYKPLIIRVAHNISTDRLSELVNYCLMSNVDAISVGSGRKALSTVNEINRLSNNRIPVIVCDNSLSKNNVGEWVSAGASLIMTNASFKHRSTRYATKVLRRMEQF